MNIKIQELKDDHDKRQNHDESANEIHFNFTPYSGQEKISEVPKTNNKNELSIKEIR